MALTDALKAALEPGVLVGVGDRPAGVTTKPFIVMWPDAPVRTAHTAAQPNGKQTTTIVCHCMGLTKDSAAIAEQKLADAVYGLYGTTVGGMTVEYPEQLSALPLARDDDVSPPLYDLAVEWRLRTTPST